MSKDIKKALEHCVEYACIDCPNSDECGSGTTVCRERLLTKVLEYVTDLEAKLKESEKNVEFYKERYSDATTSAYGADLMAKDYQWHLEKENNEIKQQLAEKEKEIKYLTKQAKKLNNEAQKYFEDAYCNDFHNQDKIDFAVAELEKVKEKVICGVMDIGNPFWSYFRKDGGQYMTSEDLHNALEQEFTYQIQEQIKEME